jgi:hypothetical protein
MKLEIDLNKLTIEQLKTVVALVESQKTETVEKVVEKDNPILTLSPIEQKPIMRRWYNKPNRVSDEEIEKKLRADFSITVPKKIKVKKYTKLFGNLNGQKKVHFYKIVDKILPDFGVVRKKSNKLHSIKPKDKNADHWASSRKRMNFIQARIRALCRENAMGYEKAFKIASDEWNGAKKTTATTYLTKKTKRVVLFPLSDEGSKRFYQSVESVLNGSLKEIDYVYSVSNLSITEGMTWDLNLWLNFIGNVMNNLLLIESYFGGNQKLHIVTVGEKRSIMRIR